MPTPDTGISSALRMNHEQWRCELENEEVATEEVAACEIRQLYVIHFFFWSIFVWGPIFVSLFFLQYGIDSCRCDKWRHDAKSFIDVE